MRKKKTLAAIGAACLLALMLIDLRLSGAAGTIFYVKKTGSDSNNCTAAQSSSTPKLTLASALPCLSGGDTLMVSAGTYAEFINDAIPSGADSSHRTLVKCDTSRACTIQPTSGQNPFRVVYFQDDNHIEVNGFFLDATNVQLEGVKITVTTAPATSTDIVINDCDIENSPTMGILITGDLETGCVVEYSTIQKNGNDPGNSGLYHQIYIDSPGHTVHDCVLAGDTDNTTGHGVHIYGNETMSGQQIYHNIIHDVGTGAGLYGGDNQKIWGNLFYNCDLAIRVRSYAAIGTVYIYGNSQYGITNIGILLQNIAGDPAFGTVNVRDNIVSNGITVNVASGTVNQDHNLTTSASYVDATNHDFHLTSGSAAKDTGTDLSSIIGSLDKDGVARPQGSAWDIGAYEFLGGASTPGNTGRSPVSNRVKANARTRVNRTGANRTQVP